MSESVTGGGVAVEGRASCVFIALCRGDLIFFRLLCVCVFGLTPTNKTHRPHATLLVGA